MKIILVRSNASTTSAFKAASALASAGHEVRVLIWDRGGREGGPTQSQYVLHRFKLGAPYDRFSALLFLPLWWIYELLFLLRCDADVLHPCDLDTLFPAIAASLLRRKPLCYTIYDFYADNLSDGFPQPLRTAIRRLVATLERFGIRFAAVLFLVDESRLQQVKGAKVNHVVYIYNSPPDLVSGQLESRPPHAGTCVIFYAGSLIRNQRGLEDMLGAVAGLSGVTLLLAGSGPDEEYLRRLAADRDNVRFLGWLNYDDMLRGELASDILFRLSDPKIPSTRYASPNKLFEAMMCGKPIIVSDASAMADIVRQHDLGLVVPYGDVTMLREAILQLRDEPDRRRELGANGRRSYEDLYSWEKMERRITEAYQDLETDDNNVVQRRKRWHAF